MAVENTEEYSNVSEVRIAKFEILIKDTNDMLAAKNRFSQSVINTSLAMIYDYDKLNNYGKVIMEKSRIYLLPDDNSYTDLWASKYSNTNKLKDVNEVIRAAKDFVYYCRMSENISEGYKFIFWALMILTVDKTDAEEHLSLICDFARMLHITDAELQEIIYIIKLIYNEGDTDYVFKCMNIASIFGRVFYSYDDMDKGVNPKREVSSAFVFLLQSWTTSKIAEQKAEYPVYVKDALLGNAPEMEPITTEGKKIWNDVCVRMNRLDKLMKID